MADHDDLVTLGIDTHADIHVAAALDRVGRVLGTIVIETTTTGANQLHALVVTAPEHLHRRLAGLTLSQLVDSAVRFRPGDHPDDPDAATQLALRSLARCYRNLTEELQSWTLNWSGAPVGQTERPCVEKHDPRNRDFERFGPSHRTVQDLWPPLS